LRRQKRLCQEGERYFLIEGKRGKRTKVSGTAIIPRENKRKKASAEIEYSARGGNGRGNAVENSRLKKN